MTHTRLRTWTDRHWASITSALLHALAIGAVIVSLPSLLPPVSHSDNSARTIAVEVVHLPPPAPPSQAPAEPQATEAPPILQSPTSDVAIAAPVARKTVAIKAKPIAASVAPPAQTSEPIPQTEFIPESQSTQTVVLLPTGLAGPPPDYLALVRLQLERNKVYPRMAQVRRQEGRVMLRFTIDRDGRVLSHTIARSSGFTMLDGETEAMLARAAPLPPMPSEMSESQIELTVPVEFRLSDTARR